MIVSGNPPTAALMDAVKLPALIGVKEKDDGEYVSILKLRDFSQGCTDWHLSLYLSHRACLSRYWQSRVNSLQHRFRRTDSVLKLPCNKKIPMDA